MTNELPNSQTQAPSPIENQPSEQAPVRVIGIGADVGGLADLTNFFAQMPEATRLAFVVVGHSTGAEKRRLTTRLQASTRLPVTLIEDGMSVESGHIYVAPSRRQLTLENNQMRLSELLPMRARTMPIDFFLQTLANQRRTAAVGILLAGKGNDGRQGLRAIKAEPV